MRSLTLRYCFYCKRHRGGKIWNFEGKDCCDACWRKRLDWHETRGNLIAAIKLGSVCGVSVTEKPVPKDYAVLSTIASREADRASFQLKYGNSRDFARAFVRAMWAHEEMK